MKKHFLNILTALMCIIPLPSALHAQGTSEPLRLHTAFQGGEWATSSPGVSTQKRYGDCAMDLFHGRMGLQIPLYEYNDQDFSLPFTLGYSTQGYQPGQAVGEEGLGWSLSCGGSITREVRGIPDDAVGQERLWKWLGNTSKENTQLGMSGVPPSGYDLSIEFRNLSAVNIEGYYALWSMTPQQYANVTVLDCYYDGGLNHDYEYYWQNPSSGQAPKAGYETQSDIYHFSAPGIEGDFILEPCGGFKVYNCNVPSGCVSVEWHWQTGQVHSASTFVIRTGDGLRYEFANTETSMSYDTVNGSVPSESTTSSWRLTSVTAPNGQTATFHYRSANTSSTSYSTSVIVDRLRLRNTSNVLKRTWAAADDEGGNISYVNTPYHTTVNHVDYHLLDSVTVSDRAAVALEYGSNGALTSLTVYNSQRDVVKRVDMTYNDGAPQRTPRFLKSVSVGGEGTWSFSYWDEDGTFPYPDTYETDNLGFYNKKGSYRNITIPGYVNGMELESYAASVLASRTPSLQYSRMGALKRIEWPTGGYSQIFYGLNKVQENGLETDSYGIRPELLEACSADGTLLQRRELIYEDEDGDCTGVSLQTPQIYYRYEILTDGYDTYREAVSTQSSVGLGTKAFLEYPTVREQLRGANPSEGVCEIMHCYQPSDFLGLTYLTEYYSSDTGESAIGNDGWSYQYTNSVVPSDRQMMGESYNAGKEIRTVEKDLATGRTVSDRTSQWTTTPVPGLSATSFHAMLCNRPSWHNVNPRHCFLSSASETKPTVEGDMTMLSRYGVDQKCRHSYTVISDAANGNMHTAQTSYLGDTTNPQEDAEMCYDDLSSRTRIEYIQRSLNQNNPWYVPSALKIYDLDSRMWVTQATVTSWDMYGNPTSITDKAGLVTEWTWGYDGMYPVQKRQRVSPAITLVTSWTWKPLVGMTSCTLPSGRTLSYEYDSNGRLIETSDAGAVTSRTSYNIVTEDSDETANWIRTTSYQDLAGQKAATDISFFGALGHPLLDAALEAGKDILVPHSQDALMRETRSYLPYVRAVGGGMSHYDSMSLQHQREWNAARFSGDTCAFNVEMREYAPSGRILSKCFPGRYHQLPQNSTTIEYHRNAAESVPMFRVRREDCSLRSGGFYRQGDLLGVKTTDSDGVAKTEWKDAMGRIVAEDRFPEDTLARTLYVYDQCGNLSWVMPPEGYASLMEQFMPYYENAMSWWDGSEDVDPLAGYALQMSAAVAVENCYMFKFDGRGNVVEKSTPGKGRETFAYDNADRLARSRDAVLMDEYFCMKYSYDKLGRMTGMVLYDEGSEEEYRCLQSASYNGPGGMKSAETFVSNSGGREYDFCRTFTYDSHDRVSAVHEWLDTDYGHHLYKTFTYDLAGNVIQERDSCIHYSEMIGTHGSQTDVSVTDYVYDTRGRLLEESLALNGSTVAEVSYEYDDLGVLRKKIYGDGIEESRTYTEQGWLSDITSGIFREHMQYTYAGRIGYREESFEDESCSTYNYDSCGRLLSIDSEEDTYVYNLNSDLTSIEDYRFTYDGARRQTVYTRDSWENLGDYEYDACGRVTYDPIRNLTIEWNRLGMPVSIKNEAEDEYAFEYLADGTLLRAGGRTYAGSFILDEDGAVEKLTFADGVSTSEGLVDYYLRDHLGSVRASVDGMSEDYGQLSYSPYGVSSTSEDYPGGSILHTFIGKEKVKIADESAWTQQPYLNFGARLYDAATGHFLSTDPLAEKYFGINPYIYCAGDPVNSLDPNGAYTKVCRNEDGTYNVVGGELDDDLGIYVYSQDENGDYTIRGECIGESATIKSFYSDDADDAEKWQGEIDPNDMSGCRFLSDIKSKKISLPVYLVIGRSKHLADFKETNYQPKEERPTGLNHYRGMPIGRNGTNTIYASARDVGNMGAGIIAALNKIPYNMARKAFDGYQTVTKWCEHPETIGTKYPEPECTVKAQEYGYYTIGCSIILDNYNSSFASE